MTLAKSLIRKVLATFGYNLVRTPSISSVPAVLTEPTDDPLFADLLNKVTPYTMTSPERVKALREAVRYITRAKIEGAIVECGVWRGGSMMAVAETLLELDDVSRPLYLFDTFEGMTSPTDEDLRFDDVPATSLLEEADRQDPASYWCAVGLDEVRSNMGLTEYPQEKIAYVLGKVEETIPDDAPDRIALLRLDTDWYESTWHELVHLIPRLSPGAVLIIDDYGYWQGVRRAVDTYLEEHRLAIFLIPVDLQSRVAVVGARERTPD